MPLWIILPIFVNNWVMKKSILSVIIDLIVTYGLIFLIFFVWINYLLKDALSSFALCSAICIFIFSLSYKRKKLKYASLKKEQKTKQYKLKISSFFLFNSEEENINFFFSLFSKNYEITKENTYLLLKKDNLNIAFFPIYSSKQITDSDVIRCFKICKQQQVTRFVIVCNACNVDALNLCSQLSTKTYILNCEQTFDGILCKYNTFPPVDNTEKVKDKITIKFFYQNAINRKKAKTYFFGGLIMLLSSFLIIYNIYYIIFSSVLFFMCFLCLISKNNLAKPEEVV